MNDSTRQHKGGLIDLLIGRLGVLIGGTYGLMVGSMVDPDEVEESGPVLSQKAKLEATKELLRGRRQRGRLDRAGGRKVTETPIEMMCALRLAVPGPSVLATEDRRTDLD